VQTLAQKAILHQNARMAQSVSFMSSAPPRLPVTQSDIARALGIADSTVSRALKNNPKIPLEHRRHIQETAQRMGYRINPMASALAQWKQNRGTNTIQSSIAWLNLWPEPKKLHLSKEFSGYWRGAKKAAEKLGYHVEEFIVNEDLPLPRLESVLQTRGVNGILLPPHPFPPAWGGFDWRNFFIVRYGRSCLTPKTHLVAADQMQNVLLALQTIRARGYHRVGFVTGAWSTRRGGWMQAGAMLHQSTLPKKEQVPMLLFGDLGLGVSHQ
jgi:DNA-binding LacI/PurR family transcriptional regulator